MKLTKSIGVIAATWIVSFVAPMSWAGQGPESAMQSAGQSVVLVAQMPATIGAGGMVNPVPQSLLADGQTAEMVVLQESWTLARGQSLHAECQVVTGPQATAQVFTSRSEPLATSFAGTASFAGTSEVQTVPLIDSVDLSKGSKWDTQILLIVHDGPEDTSSASVRITLVAL